MWGRHRNWTDTSAAYPNDNNIKREDFKLKKQSKKSKKSTSSVAYDAKYRSLSAYLRTILRTSLLTSVPEIVGSKSTFKRGIKILVFMICLVGFIYQTLNFLWFYLSYPTVVNVLISNPFNFEQPSITVCNRNRRRRSVLCGYADIKCSFYPEDDFCVMYPRYCVDRQKTIFTGLPFVNDFISTDFDWNYQRAEGHTERVILKCLKTVEKNRTSCKKPYTPVAAVTAAGEPNICYVIDSLWGEPNAEPETYPNTFTIDLQLYAEPHEYKDYNEPILLQIAVHDRRRLVNPYRQGYALKAGRKYEATVTMTEKQLLPSPYDTNCTDYLELWKENNGTGPMNDLACIEKCKLESLLKEGECIDRNVGYPHMERLCATTYQSMTLSIIEACTQQCEQPCHDQLYDVRFEEINNIAAECTTEWCNVHKSYVTFYFNQFRVTKFRYQPKFESVEMFSYIGGYMGMWLGLSLVSLFDFLETIAFLLYYPVGVMRRKAKKKKTKPNLNAFHGSPYYGVQVY